MKKQHTGSALSSFNHTPIPGHIVKLHQNLTLGIYLFYVKCMLFLHTISRKIQFLKTLAIDNRQKKTIVEEVKNVIKIYTVRGFNVVDIHGD